MIDAFSSIQIIGGDDIKRFALMEQTIDKLQERENQMFNQYGPSDSRYHTASHDLTVAFLTSHRYQEALKSSTLLEKFATRKLSEWRLENLYLMGEALVSMGRIIESLDLIGPLTALTNAPVVGWWTRYWNLHFQSLEADIARLKKREEEEELRRFRCADIYAREFGMDLTVTMEERLKLGECQERRKDYERALLHYQAVYAHFHAHSLFPTPEDQINLLSHIYVTQKHLGQKDKQVETYGWLKNAMGKHGVTADEKKKIFLYLRAN